MQKIALLTLPSRVALLIALLTLSCSKHHAPAPLTPEEVLLTSSIWKLQRADSTHYADDIVTVTARTTFVPANCSQQPHYIFNTDHSVKGYPSDSVITLTKDSLVVEQTIIAFQYFLSPVNGAAYDHDVKVINRYTP